MDFAGTPGVAKFIHLLFGPAEPQPRRRRPVVNRSFAIWKEPSWVLWQVPGDSR